MKELPKPEGQLAWQTYTRDQVLAVQKQAYEDALRDARKFFSDNSDLMFWGSQAAKHIADMLTASQKRDE